MAALFTSTPISAVFESNNVREMDAPNYSCYANNNNNNNNYIHGFPATGILPYVPSPVTAQALCIPTMPSSVYQTSQMGPVTSTNFTFTTPTQGNIISHAPPLYTAPISSIPGYPQQPHIVPGIGAQWQHTVPQNMPWAVASQGQITEFTAQLSASYNPFSCQSEPRASCSFTHRRPKRHFMENDLYEAPSTKVRISDELMMARMQGLHITTPELSKNTPTSLLQSSWQKLRDLEERLEDDPVDIDDTPCSMEVKKGSLPCLRLKEGINPEDLLKPDPILPKKILDDLNKPCMEVVLWKPPVIAQNLEDVTTSKADNNDLDIDDSSDSRNLPNQTFQQTVTTVTPSVPSLSYGDNYAADLQPACYNMESSVCEDDDMDL